MRSWLTWLLKVNNPDENIRRRGRNIIYVILGVFLLIAFITVVWLVLTPPSHVFLLSTMFPSLVYIGIIALVRRGHVDAGGILVFLLQLSITVYILTSSMGAPWGILMFMTPLIFASISLRSWQLWIAFVAVAAGRIVVSILGEATPIDLLAFQILAFGVFTLMLFLGTRSLEDSLGQSNALRRRAEASSLELVQANDSLEQMVNMRTADLQQALTEVREREGQLTATLDRLVASQEMIRSLTAPIIPILPGVLVVPLTGMMDNEQADRMMEQILERVRTQRTTDLILDVTGVPIMDTHVANTVMQIAQAVQLLWAQTVLVGIRPEVAQTLVALNIAFGKIAVFADLQGAVLSRLGQFSWKSAMGAQVPTLR